LLAIGHIAAEKYRKIGDKLMEKGEYKKAVDAYSKQFFLAKRKGLPFFDAAKKFQDENNYKAAISNYTQRAVAYYKRNQLNKVFDDITKALSLNVSNDHAYHLRSMTYLQQGKYNKALKDARKSIELDPDETTYENLGNILKKEKQFRKLKT